MKTAGSALPCQDRLRSTHGPLSSHLHWAGQPRQETQQRQRRRMRRVSWQAPATDWTLRLRLTRGICNSQVRDASGGHQNFRVLTGNHLERNHWRPESEWAITLANSSGAGRFCGISSANNAVRSNASAQISSGSRSLAAPPLHVPSAMVLVLHRPAPPNRPRQHRCLPRLPRPAAHKLPRQRRALPALLVCALARHSHHLPRPGKARFRWLHSLSSPNAVPSAHVSCNSERLNFGTKCLLDAEGFSVANTRL